MKYKPIMGLEIHVEPTTKSKMFCDCDAQHFQVKPNTHTCPVCLGLPGALPVPNFEAIKACQLIGVALNCKLATHSKFDRKNYFYPDLAKAYQISQYDQPLCHDGKITLKSGKTIGITRAHMEEDTAKNSHQIIDGKKKTLVDYNRSGVPLVEIVTEPDFRTPEEVDEYLKSIRKILRFLGISDCDMEKGSMRLEVNLSLATPDHFNSDGSIKKFPTYKVELKNINSFRYIQKAIQYEIKRQSQLLDQGITPDQETRGYQEDINKTISQRSKEDAQDYRYFPEPDIPPMEFDQTHINSIKKMMKELPDAIQARLEKDYNIKPDTSAFLVEDPKLTQYFEDAIAVGSKQDLSASDIAKAIKNKKFNWEKLNPTELVKKMIEEKSSVVTDNTAIEPIVKQVIKDNPNEVERFKAGEKKLIGFFMGQCMKALRGKGDATIINSILMKLLQN